MRLKFKKMVKGSRERIGEPKAACLDKGLLYEKIYISWWSTGRGGNKMSEQHVILDIRSEEEYVAGHIPGARHCPLQELTFLLNDVETDDLITVVCRTGQR